MAEAHLKQKLGVETLTPLQKELADFLEEGDGGGCGYVEVLGDDGLTEAQTNIGEFEWTTAKEKGKGFLRVTKMNDYPTSKKVKFCVVNGGDSSVAYDRPRPPWDWFGAKIILTWIVNGGSMYLAAFEVFGENEVRPNAELPAQKKSEEIRKGAQAILDNWESWKS
eukprot:TRINITY_DN66180_c2_g17_i1.p1 TRINITY_DN66180_c2_g17~~TRINITY_DN66180_c2_g17_i1.p1  ORF type:complete len:166 (+),score=18.81 TRINITY_DN66180_c2_g17_i1:76-573(+)